MKALTLKQRKNRAKANVSTAGVMVDLAPQIAKAAAYLDRTSAQFASNVQKAKLHLKDFEGGVMAGPVSRR